MFIIIDIQERFRHIRMHPSEPSNQRGAAISTDYVGSIGTSAHHSTSANANGTAGAITDG